MKGSVKYESSSCCSANGHTDHRLPESLSYTGMPQLLGEVTRERDSSSSPLASLSASGTVTVALLFGEGVPDRASDVLQVRCCGWVRLWTLGALDFGVPYFLSPFGPLGPLPWRLSKARRLDDGEVSTSSRQIGAGRTIMAHLLRSLAPSHSQMHISQIRHGLEGRIQPWACGGGERNGRHSNGEGIDVSRS
jgi:hypothetical protein